MPNNDHINEYIILFLIQTLWVDIIVITKKSGRRNNPKTLMATKDRN